MKKKILGWLSLTLLAGALAIVVPTVWFRPWSIDHFYARVFLNFMLRHPMLLSSLRILEPMGLDFHSDDLDDMSVDFAVKEAKWAEGQLAVLRSYDTSGMAKGDRLSRDVLEWYLQDTVEQNRFLFHGYPVNQAFGIQSGVAEFMVTTHQVKSPKEARNYVLRLSRFSTFFDQLVANLRYREARGIVPPRFVLEKVGTQMRAFVADPPKQNPLYKSFAEKLQSITTLPTEERDRLLAEAEKQMETAVYPAYARLIAECSRLEAKATEDDGVWKLPDGDAYYEMSLRHHTTTRMTPDQVHALGVAEVQRIESEMRAILEARHLPTDDIGATMTRLGQDPRFLYPDSDQGRASILADYQKYVDEMNAALGRFIAIQPKAAIKVARMPAFREATSPVAYYDHPALDGSRPGTFYVNLRNVKEHARFGMRTLAYHEAVPGHHFQIALAQEIKGAPFFRRVIPFTAHIEGWALYAERLAAENGFEDDPFDRLGYLQAQMFRAVRLVVDTGIHRKHWTRAQAVDYMRRRTGMEEANVVAEVERYVVTPAQACAYMVGQLKILELREKARQHLGERFDPPQFNRVLVEEGALPLTLLEQRVEAWIASQ